MSQSRVSPAAIGKLRHGGIKVVWKELSRDCSEKSLIQWATWINSRSEPPAAAATNVDPTVQDIEGGGHVAEHAAEYAAEHDAAEHAAEHDAAEHADAGADAGGEFVEGDNDEADAGV